ncbi:MAG: hypothetical protein CMJ81_03695 [Planctomycetaceae bacterium]|nr:hypothetical protein [Planctomycetaceae bacterium]MBP61319.1 hypothetical protein [Planctomycetaceae bacterium]
MKVKVSFDSDAVKSFLLSHVEKLVLFLVVVLCTYFLVYRGFQREVSTITPEKMENLVRSAQTNIDKTVWSDISSERIQVVTYDEKARNSGRSINKTDYHFGPIHQLVNQPQAKRTDPKLYTVVQLETDAIFAPVSVDAPAGEVDLEEEEGITKGRPLSPDEVKNWTANRTNPRRRGGAARGGIGINHAKGYAIVKLVGLVPIREQLQEYRDHFFLADDFLGRRDFPRYVFHEVRRREVSLSGETGPWVEIDTKEATNIINSWTRPETEVAESRFLYTTGKEAVEYGMTWLGLHWPLPPIIMRDVTRLALHSQVPVQEVTPNRNLNNAPRDGLREFDIEDPGLQPRRMERSNRTSTGRLGGMEKLKTDFYLFRFLDFDVKPGRSYQYQVQLHLEDPNNPSSGDRPTEQSLDITVVNRILSLDPTEAGIRKTEWSEVSPVVHVPASSHLLVGTPDPQRRVTLQKDRVYAQEPTARVMAVDWHDQWALEIPAERKVRRGSVLDFSRDKVRALSPQNHQLWKLQKYDFDLGIIVADLRGGERLGRTDLKAPTEMLLIGKQGNFSVRHELQDHSVYQRYVFDEEE